ncbi:MAG: response regulator [Acidobacteriia bacterium]|nr:response regulator [Terriglobia bacterium]
MPGSATEFTVLVVEDVEPLRKMVRRMLLDGGYAVIEAANGQEALSALERHANGIHLLLTDLMMPGMNGAELAREASRISPALPILFMSGYADDPLVNDIANQASSFVAKPFTAPVLVAKVRETLTRSASDGTDIGSAS